MPSNAARASINGLPKALGTTILLQHNGLPKTPLYAHQHLKGELENLGCPSVFSGKLASWRYRFYGSIQAALRQTGEYLPLEESHRRFGVELQRKLTEVLPEFSPFNAQFSYLYHEPYIQDVVRGIVDKGTDRLISMSLYPFEIPHCLEPMKKATTSVLNEALSELIDFNTGKRTYVANNRPVSFDFEQIDCIGTHASFIQYWAERLVLNLNDADSIIFAVPISISFLKRYRYYTTIMESAERIMYTMNHRLSHAVTYRVAFYTPWDHVVPIFPAAKSIRKQLEIMSRFEHHKPLIVPFGSFFKDFDTEYILPDSFPNLNILRPDEQDSNLVHTFIEILKSRILTEKYEKDKEPSNPLF